MRLDAITEDNVTAVFDLGVFPGQEAYVAPNSWSLAQAVAEHGVAWPRAIVAGDEVVGFLMLEIDPHRPDGLTYRLWRLMVAAERQGEGIGTAALSLAIHEIRARGGTQLYTSWREGQGSPGPFYEHFGFIATGEVVAGEIVARLAITPDPAGAQLAIR